MPPALPSTTALHLLPESPGAWDIAESPAPAPAAVKREGKECLTQVANGLALAVAPVSGVFAIAIGEDLMTTLLQAGLTSTLTLALLHSFAHVAAQALARH